MEERSFSSLGRVEAVRQLFEGTGYEPFGEPLSYGEKRGARAVCSSVLLTEGVDFDLVYFPLRHLGYKAVTIATGELYAALASPKTISLTLGISAKLDFDKVREFWEGVAAAAKMYSYGSLSLELQPSRNGFLISVAATGELSGGISRPAPQSKDLLCVSGSLGAAYLGLQVLEREKERFNAGSSSREEMEKYRMLVGAYLKPEIPVGIPEAFKESGIIPSAGCLVGKGLADAALRLSRSTGFGVKIYAGKIPFEGGSFDFGRTLDADPVSAAMNGGEDYQLLYAVPILSLEKFRKDFQTFEIIGHLALPEAGAVLVEPEGVELPITAQGW